MKTKNQTTALVSRSIQPLPLGSGAAFARWVTLLVCCAGLLSLPAYGALKTWVAPVGNGNWGTSGNWSPSGAPAAGDDLSFPAGAVQLVTTNNLTRNFSSIAFSGAGGGYVLRGNPLALTNGLTAAHSVGVNTVEFTITNGASQTITATTGGTLAMNGNIVFNGFNLTVNNTVAANLGGVLSGTGNLIKNGAGNLLLNGLVNNTYTGTTTVNAGTLELNDVGAATAMVPGNLVINTSGTLLLTEGNQIADSADVTVNGSGVFNLNGWSETIGNNLTFTSGGSVSLGAGTLTLGASSTINVTNGGSVSGTGYLNIGSGTCTIQGSGNFSLYANVSGSANIVKNGTVALYLWGANTFTGTLTANTGGFVYVLNSLALGATNNGTFINDSAYLAMSNDLNVTNEALTMNSSSIYAIDIVGSSTNVWIGTFALNADTSIYADVNCALNLVGPIGGTGGVTKTGPGTLTYSGSTANTYSGATAVNDGTLLLAKTISNGGVVGSALTIGDGTGAANSAVVRDSGTFQISNTPDITINSDGLLDLNDIGEAVGNSLTLNSGRIQTGLGSLTLAANAFITNSGSSFIYDNFNIGSGTCTIQGAGYLYLYADVGGSANIVKNDSVALYLSGDNTFTGTLTCNTSGALHLVSSTALGGTNGGTILNNNTFIYLYSNVNITNESLTLNSAANPVINDYFTYSTNVWITTNFTLSANAVLYVETNSLLELRGPIGGTGGVTKIGSGRLVYSGNSENTYGGLTTVKEGELDLAKGGSFIHAIPRYGPGLMIGDGVGTDVVRNFNHYQVWGDAPVTITNSGIWDINNYQDAGDPLTLNGGQITTGSGLCAMINTVRIGASSYVYGNVRLDSPSVVFSNTAYSYLYMNAAVAGYSSTYGLTKAGYGFMYLSASNSYGGVTVVQGGGWLQAENPWALGATSGGTVVSNGASLVLSSIGITNEALTLNGPGVNSGWAALDVESGISTWAGPITNNANSTLDAWGSGSELHVNGPISGAGGLELFNIGSGGGTHYFEGAAANTYAGTTRVDAGCVLDLNKTAGVDAIRGDLTLNGTVHELVGNQINNSSTVTIGPSGYLDLSGGGDGIGSLNGSGSVYLGAAFVNSFGSGVHTYNGVISGTGTFYVAANGLTYMLNGNNIYTGQTYLYDGYTSTVMINGSQPQSAVYVGNLATLGGTGTVGSITANGNVAPGNSPGILNSSNTVFSSTGDYFVELTGPNAGTDYDQLNVRGTSTLGNAVLHVTTAFASPVALGQQFTIINNDGSDANVGIFLGYPEGANYSSAGYNLKISYIGGTGNDVVLTLTSLPSSVVGSTVIAGNGSRTIDPNECNNVYLTLTNTSGVTMSSINATLSTTTRGVVITQPYATYPNLAANGRGTNLAPFQISTLPSFVCGTDISLQLIVDSSVGSFIINYVLHSGAVASTPSRYDNNVATAIPDVGSIDSTNTVSSFGGPLEKVTVSLWLTHTLDSDLSLSLVSPDGTAVPLTINIGAGANFGTGSADANRTLFDDVAGTPIAAGTPPFVGTYRPQGSLSNYFYNPVPNGDWRLRITDSFGGSLGTLRNWSLFLYGPSCSAGGGVCDYCLASISGSIANTDLIQTNRISRDNTVASCGMPKVWPGFAFGGGGNYHYDVYAFTNTSAADACVTALLTASCDVQSGIYLNAFDPVNITTNYLGDSGDSTVPGSGGAGFLGGPQSCSVTVPAGAKFFVTVNEITSGAGCTGYTLQLSGLPCPPPKLNIQPVPPNKARLYWDTSAGGYLLEAKTNLLIGAWGTITNEPIVIGGYYNVTNSTLPPTNRFYRLHQP